MSEKLNVLFIISDQHRSDHMSCAGNKILKTPNLDRLASEGVRFTNAFCTNPMCMPNRATLLTGLYPNTHGVRSNGMILSKNIPTITKTLVKRGWHTIAIGKLHYQFNTPPYRTKTKSAESFGDWVFEKKGYYPVRENFPMPYYGYNEVDMILGHGSVVAGPYLEWLEMKAPDVAKGVMEKWSDINNFFSVFCDNDIPEELYTTQYVEDRTIQFFERYTKGNYGNKPFYLHCSFPDPHGPVCPPGKYENMYKPEEVELPKSFNEIKKLYEHPFLAQHLINPVFRGAMLRETTEEEARKFIAYTYGTVAMIDDSIGKILTSLKKLGLADNTIVVYSSDHGDLMGEYGMLFKGPSPFNGVLQIPMIWKVPGISSPGISDSMISSIDYPKTILKLLDIPERHQPPDMQGYDMTPVLKDPSKKVRDCCLIVEDEEVGPMGPLFARLRHLITNDYKLTIYEGIENYGDLYSRKNDPAELKNLWFDESYKNTCFDMVNKLLHECLKVQTKYPKRLAGT